MGRVIDSESPVLGIDLKKTNTRKNTVENLIDKGIIDPVLVVKNGLLYGSSIASILLTSDCAVLRTGNRHVNEHDEFIL